ncbi:MAG TPA: CoA pyrophosphatase [Longimicrobium sp.]|nr:CoA pyrophosphatase [Longimicrobium sp.]
MTAPRFAALEAALASRPAFQASAGEGAGRAAVALLLRPTGAEPELLLIRRAEREGDPWSGHMALPGGRAAPADPDPVATAARESAEEVGIDPSRAGRLLGALDEVAPRSSRGPAGLVVSPFVFAVAADAAAVPNHEVQEALWISVAELLRPEAVTEYLHELAEGSTLRFPAFDARGYVVWGMTHRILTGFLELYAQVIGEVEGS